MADYSEKAAQVRALAQQMNAESAERTAEAKRLALEYDRQAGTALAQKKQYLDNILTGLQAEGDLLNMNAHARRKQIQELLEHQERLSEGEQAQLAFLQSVDKMTQAQRSARIKDHTQRQKAADVYNETLSEHIEKMKTLNEEGKQVAKSIKSWFGLGSRGHMAMFDKMTKAFTSWEGLKGFASEMISFETAQQGINSVLDKFIDATIKSLFAQDNAEASLAGLTGGVQKYNSALKSSTIAGMRMGVNFEDQRKSLDGLYRGYANFSSMNAKAMGRLSLTATALDRMGVSTDLFASNMNELTKTFGMTGKEAEGFSVRMASFARAIGVNAGKMAKDFASSMPRLQLFGGNMERVFTNLAKQAKATGAEVSDLLGIARGFDTFGEAQDKVNKLNQLMGGNYLNSVKMVSMADDERLEYLRKKLKAQGLLGKNMDHLTKKALMAIVGEKGLNALLKEGNTSEEERLKIQKKAAAALEKQKSRQQMKDLMNAATRALPVFEQITRMLERAFADEGVLGQIKKFIPYVRDLLDRFREWRNENGLGIVKILGIGLAIKGVIAALGLFWSAISGGGSLIGSIFSSIGSVFSGIFKPVNSVLSLFGFGGDAGAGGGSTLANLGKGFMGFGVGIGVAAAGLAYLASTFAGLDAEQRTVAMESMKEVGWELLKMFGAAAVIARLAGKPLHYLGLAVQGIGIGVAAAAGGASIFLMALQTSLPTIEIYMETLKTMAEIIKGMVKPLTTLGWSGFGAAAALTALGVAFALVAAALNVVPAWAQDSITHVIMQTADVAALVTAAPAAAAAVAPAGTVAPAAGAAAVGGTTTSAGVAPRPIIMEIDKREFGRAVMEAVDDNMRLGWTPGG